MEIGYYERLFETKAFERHLVTVERLKSIASGLDITVVQLAIAWILRLDAVTSAIVGAKRPAQIEETAGAGDVVLDEATLSEIEKILQ